MPCNSQLLKFYFTKAYKRCAHKKLYFNQPSILWKNTSLYEEGSDIEEDFLNIYKNKSERTLKELTFVDGEEIICSVWFR